MTDLVQKFQPYLENPVFVEVLELVKQNSKGKIWLMGGFLYRNLAAALYGGETYTKDIDFLVEEREDFIKKVSGWNLKINRYGAQNYFREGNFTSFTDLRKVARHYGVVKSTALKFIEETPLDIQSIAYDLDENKLIGEKGIKALKNKMIKVNNKEQAEFYAKRKEKELKDIIIRKATQMNFGYEL